MDKFFDIIKKLRGPAQQGKISRQAAIDALMQESGVSEAVAARAADNMLATKPEVPGGITSIKPEIEFTLPEKIETVTASLEEKTGGYLKEGINYITEPATGREIRIKSKNLYGQDPPLKEGKDYRITKDGYVDVLYKDPDLSTSKLTEEEAPGLFSLRRDIESLADEESWKYSQAVYKQNKAKAMEPYYKKYGAQSAKDKELVDDLFEMDLEGKIVPNEFKSKAKYKEATTKMFIQESVEDIAGAEDIVTEILYSEEATKFLENQGLDNFINYAHTQLKNQGLSFNKNLLKRFLKEKFEPEGFADGGRISFGGGTGRKGIISALVDKANDIAPGSTAVGKTTKAMSEAAKRKRAEEELFAGFNERNKPGYKPGDDITSDNFAESGFAPDLTGLRKAREQYEARMAKKNDPNYKAGQGKFTKAEVLENIINNTIKAFKDDPDIGDYVTNTLPNILKEIKANPELANNKNVFNNLAKQLVNNPTQKLVVYDDDTVDFFTRKLNANGGLNYLMGF